MAQQVQALEFDEESKSLWWVLVVGGILSVMFGFVAIIWPGITIGVLALLLAVFIGITGVTDIINGVRRIGSGFFGAFLSIILGMLGLGVSVYLLRNVGSGLAIATLILLVAISFIARGVVAIVLAFSRPEYRATRWLNVTMGALSLLAGLVIAWYPIPSTLAWVWVVGFFALVSGSMQIALGISAKDASKKSEN